MPLALYRRKKGGVWHYRGTVDGRLLRRSTGTTDRKVASQIAAEEETRNWKRRVDGSTLRFPAAVAHYEKSGKGGDFRSAYYIAKLEDHWRNTKVKDMTPGAIRQSAIDLYPGCSGATWNRQVITPTQAIINHCAELELCAPIRIKRFTFDKKIKKPVTLEWLDAFCAHADKQMMALAVFMFATGCRISEARRVEWGDIDFTERTVLIRKTKNKRARQPSIPPRLLVALANLGREKPPFGDPETSLRLAWDAVIAKASEAKTGFERLTFHSCRHGLATKLLRDKVDVVTAAGLAGMSVGVMLSTYAHAIKDARLTDRIFDTPEAQNTDHSQQNQQVRENK